MEKECKVDASIIVKKIREKILKAGADEVKLKIISMLPTNVKEIMEATGLTKVPVNNHLNELEAVGLVKRYKHTGEVVKGKRTKIFLKMIKKIDKETENDIGQNANEQLIKLLNS